MARKKDSVSNRHAILKELSDAMIALNAAKARLRPSLVRVKSENRRGELDQVEESLEKAEYLLDKLSLRLNTLIVSGVLDWKSLALIREVMKRLTSLAVVDPSIMSYISRADDLIAKAWGDFDIPQEPGASDLVTINDEVKKILDEAERAVKSRRA